MPGGPVRGRGVPRSPLAPPAAAPGPVALHPQRPSHHGGALLRHSAATPVRARGRLYYPPHHWRSAEPLPGVARGPLRPWWPSPLRPRPAAAWQGRLLGTGGLLATAPLATGRALPPPLRLRLSWVPPARPPSFASTQWPRPPTPRSQRRLAPLPPRRPLDRRAAPAGPAHCPGLRRSTGCGGRRYRASPLPPLAGGAGATGRRLVPDVAGRPLHWPAGGLLRPCARALAPPALLGARPARRMARLQPSTSRAIPPRPAGPLPPHSMRLLRVPTHGPPHAPGPRPCACPFPPDAAVGVPGDTGGAGGRGRAPRRVRPPFAGADQKQKKHQQQNLTVREVIHDKQHSPSHTHPVPDRRAQRIRKHNTIHCPRGLPPQQNKHTITNKIHHTHTLPHNTSIQRQETTTKNKT